MSRVHAIRSFATMALVIMINNAAAAEQSEYGGRYTRERIAYLRANVVGHAWAKQRHDAAVLAAKRWADQSDDELWAMIPGQDLPRNIDPQMDHGKRTGGCPACRKDVYEKSNKYPWRTDIWQHPWKVMCPACEALLPANDFVAFYRSGVDDTGCFDPAKADRALLFSAAHPDPDDPQHTSLVDDGWGFSTPDGAVNRFVGYYGYMLWRHIKGGVAALANAYLFTGDPVYARKCGVMLDRIADVYPDMDWAVYGGKGWFHSGSTDGGKIEGSIWETGTVLTLADAYDKVKSGLWAQPELYSFLAGKATRYTLPSPKGTYDDVVRNIDANLLGEFIKAIKTGRKIYGNEGGPQHCVVVSAVALNREPLTGEWLDWIFKEGTVGQGALRPGEGDHVPALIVGAIDRDGVGAEGAPNYSLSWGVALGSAADLLRDYGGYARHDIYRDYPQFKKTITAGWRLGVLATATPNIGDSGSCGSRRLIAAAPEFIVRGYTYLKDPEIGLIAVRANKGRTEGLGRDILAEDPLWVEKDLARLAEEYGAAPQIAGSNRAGYGLVSTEFGPADTGQAIWMYYGLNSVAGHKSALMFGYDAYGVTVCPPLGYRELWGGWPKSVQWEDNTISHNTVVVDELPQTTVRVGRPEFFAQFPGFGGFCVDDSGVYPGVTDVYRRTMALMAVDGNASYALDLFHVRGGDDHLLSYHALNGPVTARGLTLTKQATGSYDGPDTPYGTSTTGRRMGYSWLKEVERDASPPAAFMLDCEAAPPFPNLDRVEGLHVRYHSFTPYSDIALADGIPPGAKPPTLRYLLARRHRGAGGSDSGSARLASTCVSVIEPYLSEPLIRAAERMPLVRSGAPDLEAVAMKIELANGATDYILAGTDDDTVFETLTGITFAGRMLAVRTRNNIVREVWLVRARHLRIGKFLIDLPRSAYKGKIVRMDRELSGKGRIWVDASLPFGDQLKGAEIIIENDGRRNACYTIRSVADDGGLSRIDCGEVSFVREFIDTRDYSKGYVYNFAEGASWVIPTQTHIVH